MAMDLKEIENYIKEALPNAIVEIQDLAGDGNHYSATVTAPEFSGKSKIEQHKMARARCRLNRLHTQRCLPPASSLALMPLSSSPTMASRSP